MADDNPYLTSPLGGQSDNSSSTDDDTEARIQKYSSANGVDPDLVRRMIHQESGGKSNAVSPTGARGLMQLMPGTARRFGVTDPNDPDQNLDAGTKYLKQHLDEFGDVSTALGAYNAGEGAVRKYGWAKVKNFSNKGKAHYGEYSGSTGEYADKITNGYTGNGYSGGFTDDQQSNPYFKSLTGATDPAAMAASDVQTSELLPPDANLQIDQSGAEPSPPGKAIKLPKSVSAAGSTIEASPSAEAGDGTRFRIPVKEGMQQADVLREALTQKALARGLEKKAAAGYAADVLETLTKAGKVPGLQDGGQDLDATRLQDLYKHGYADVHIADPGYDKLLDTHLQQDEATKAEAAIKEGKKNEADNAAVGAAIGAGLKKPEQEKLQKALADNLRWHYGVNDMSEFNRLPRDTQRKMIIGATAAAADDQKKKDAGQEITPDLNYQNLMRKAVGLAPNPSMIDPTKPLAKGGSFSFRQDLVDRGGGFKAPAENMAAQLADNQRHAREANEQRNAGQPFSFDATKIPGGFHTPTLGEAITPQQEQAGVIAQELNRSGPGLRPLEQRLNDRGIDSETAHSVAHPLLPVGLQTSILDSPEARRQILAAQSYLSNQKRLKDSNPLALAVTRRYGPESLALAQQGLANVMEMGFSVSPLRAFAGDDSAAAGAVHDVTNYLKDYAAINQAAAEAAPKLKGVAGVAADELIGGLYSVHKLLSIQAVTGLGLTPIMVGEAFIQNADKPLRTQVYEVGKAFAFGKALEIVPGYAQKLLGESGGAAAEFVLAHPKLTERAIGGVGFGALSGASKAIEGGTLKEVAGATVGGAVFGAGLAGGGLKEGGKDVAEFGARSSSLPEPIRAAAAKLAGREPVIAQREGSDQYASVFVDPKTLQQEQALNKKARELAKQGDEAGLADIRAQLDALRDQHIVTPLTPAEAAQKTIGGGNRRGVVVPPGEFDRMMQRSGHQWERGSRALAAASEETPAAKQLKEAKPIALPSEMPVVEPDADTTIEDTNKVRKANALRLLGEANTDNDPDLVHEHMSTARQYGATNAEIDAAMGVTHANKERSTTGMDQEKPSGVVSGVGSGDTRGTIAGATTPEEGKPAKQAEGTSTALPAKEAVGTKNADLPAPPTAETQAETPTTPSGPLAVSPTVAEPETKHEFSSTQANLPSAIADEVKAIGAKIPDADLAGDGRETKIHTTVKFGLHTNDVEDVKRVLADEGPIKITIGKLSTFPPSESSDGAEVLKLDVHSPELHRLNKKISDALPHTDTFKYAPHITVAYVKPGLAQKYVGKKHALDGHEITIDKLTFSGKDGQQIDIPLTGTKNATENVQAKPSAEKASPVDELDAVQESKAKSARPEIPAAKTKAKSKTRAGRSLAQALRALGGVKPGPESGGEWANLTNKESASSGLVNRKSGRNEEDAARSLAEDGYGIGDWATPTTSDYSGLKGAGVFEIDLGRFRAAVEDDVTGKRKSFSVHHVNEFDYEQAYRDRFGEEQPIDKLYATNDGQELTDKVISGAANETEIEQFQLLAEHHRVPADEVAGIVARGRKAAQPATETLQDAAGGEGAGSADTTSEPGQLTAAQLAEGYTLSDDGTLIDPDGSPLFHRPPEEQLGFTQEGLLQQDVTASGPQSKTSKSAAHATLTGEAALDRLKQSDDAEVRALADLIDKRSLTHGHGEAGRAAVDNLIRTLDKFQYIRSVKLTANEYLNQGTLFSGTELTSLQEGMLRSFEQYSDKKRSLDQLITGYLAEVQRGNQEFKEQLPAPERESQGALFQKAYHGSAQTFDKFSTDRIGTGEGAQAYGWGLYFAGKKEVAQHYRGAISEKDFIRKVKDTYDDQFTLDEAADELFANHDLNETERALLTALQKEDWLGFDYPHQAVQAALREPQAFDLSPVTRKALDAFGRLYQVELAPTEDEYLLWDKPLSEQSEKVSQALREAGIYDWQNVGSGIHNIKYRDGGSITGERFYRDLSKSLAKPETMERAGYPRGWGYAQRGNEGDRGASEQLHSLGIRGIKYLDGASRAKGEGDFNYVIFNDADVSIQAMYQLHPDIGKRAAVKALLENIAVERHGHRLKLNPDAYHLLKMVYDQIEYNRSGEPLSGTFDGVFNDRKLTKELIAMLGKIVEANPGSRRRVAALARMIKSAASDTGTFILYTDDGALIHEGFHGASEIGSGFKSLYGRHGDFDSLINSVAFDKASDVLIGMGYSPANPAAIVEEIAAYAWDNDYQRLGLTREEAEDYLELWFKSYTLKNGDHSIEEFERETEEAKNLIEAGKAAAGSASVQSGDSADNQRGQDVPGLQGQGPPGDQGALGRNGPPETGRDIGRPAHLGNTAQAVGQPLYSRDNESLRDHALPADATTPISSMVRTERMKNHPDYVAAKAGDVEAAARLVEDLVGPQEIAEAKAKFPAGTIFVAVHAQEASGLNAIPMALADHYAAIVGGTVDREIVQANRTYHTGATAMERLVSRPQFDGAVEKGASYAVVDDVITLGGTLAEASNFIQSNGGKVAGTIVLVNASRTATLAPSRNLIRLLEERYGNEIREIFNVEPAALTAAEASYLIGFKHADELRNRAVAAVKENARRQTAAKARAQDEGQPLFHRPDGDEELNPRQRLFKTLLESKQQTAEEKEPNGSVGSYVASNIPPSNTPPPAPPTVPPAAPPPPAPGPPPIAPDPAALADAEKLIGSAEKDRRLRDYAKGARETLLTTFTSEFTPLRFAERNIYREAKEPYPVTDMARKFEQINGAPGKAEADIIEFKRAVVEPIRKHARDFNTYLFLKRTEDRLLHDPTRKKVADWTVERARAGLAALQDKVGPKVMPTFEKTGLAYQEEMRKSLRLQVDSGRMSEALYDRILAENDFYAPFKVLKHLEGLDTDAVPGSGRRVATTQDLTKAIKGISSTDFQVGDILQSSAEQIVRSRLLAEKNLKMLELDALADLDEKGDFLRKVKLTTYYMIQYKPAQDLLHQLAMQATARNPQLLEQSLVKVGKAIQFADESGLKVAAKQLGTALGNATLGVVKGGRINLMAFTSEVIAHELGHTFDELIGSKVMKVFGKTRNVRLHVSSEINKQRKFQKELKELVKFTGLGGGEAYRSSAKERFAEFISLYIHDPKQARKLAPIWTNHFETEILAKRSVRDLVDRLSEFFQKVDGLPNIRTQLKGMDNHNYLELAIRRAFPDKAPQLAVAPGDRGLHDVAEPGFEIVKYLKDGNQQGLEVRKSLAKAIQGLNPAQTTVIGKTMMLARSGLQWGATGANAGFQVVNLLFADLPRLALVSRYGVRSPVDLVRFPLDWVYSFYTSFTGNFGHQNELFMDWLKSGAANSTIQRSITPSAFKQELGLESRKKKLLGAHHLVLDTIAKIGNAIEETTKITGLKRGLRIENITDPQAQKELMAKLVAEVRNYTGSPDFARKGIAMRDLNLFFMFINARVQGISSDMARLTGRTGKKEGGAAWARLALAIGIPALLLALLNLSDDEVEVDGPNGKIKTTNRSDYEKVPAWERDNYFMIPRDRYFVHEDSGENVRDYWRLPKREIVQLFGNTIEGAVKFARDRKPDDVKKWAVAMLENMSPVNIQGKDLKERIESVGSGLNPLFKTPLEVGTGRDFFRHQPIEPDYMKGAPSEEKYRRTTSALAIRAGQSRVAKAVGVSPLQLEHIVRATTAEGLSQFQLRKPDAGRPDYTGYPVVKRFVRSGSVEGDSGVDERVDAATQAQMAGRLQRRREAMEVIADWDRRKVKPDDRADLITDIKESDKALARELKTLEQSRKLSTTERAVRQLGVENGARARFIKAELEQLPATDREEYLQALRDKKLLTKEVERQLDDESSGFKLQLRPKK